MNQSDVHTCKTGIHEEEVSKLVYTLFTCKPVVCGISIYFFLNKCRYCLTFYTYKDAYLLLSAHACMHFYLNGIQCIHQWMVVYALDPISIKNAYMHEQTTIGIHEEEEPKLVYTLFCCKPVECTFKDVLHRHTLPFRLWVICNSLSHSMSYAFAISNIYNVYYTCITAFWCPGGIYAVQVYLLKTWHFTLCGL